MLLVYNLTMTFHIITIFPEALKEYLSSSILGRAQKNKKIKIKFYNPREWAKDKHKQARLRRQVDDKPFGGGPGMVMKVDVIVKTVQAVLNGIKKSNRTNRTSRTKIIVFSPAGKQFTQKTARNWAKKYKDIILISGRYEGVDARLKKVIQDLGFKIQEISIGPYVLTGGELPAGIIVDAVSRHIPGVLGKEESLEEKRGVGIPAYTRPEVFEYGGKKYRAPKVLMSGHHKKIEEWRKKRRKSQ